MRDTPIAPSRGLFILGPRRWIEGLWMFRSPVFSSKPLFVLPPPLTHAKPNKDLLTHKNSSWLGGGSEFLIASAFEFGPPVGFSFPSPNQDLTRGSEMLKARTMPLVEDEDGDDGATTTATRAAPIPKAVKKEKAKKKNKAYDSPLAKLFGRPTFSTSPEEETILKDKDVDKGKKVKVVEQQVVSGKEGDVEQLKKEVGLVRQSQLRMEEMLAGFLAGKSA